MLARIMLCLTLVLAAPASLYGAAATPFECLQGINQAVANADLDSLEQFADLDSLLEEALNAYLAEARKEESQKRLAPVMALILAQLEQGDGRVRALLLSEARSFLENGIQSGAFAGKKSGNSQSHGMLAPLFAHASLGKKEIRGIGEPVADETGWIVPFSVHDYGNDRDYLARGRISRQGDACKLIKIENIGELIQQIQQEEAQTY